MMEKKTIHLNLLETLMRRIQIDDKNNSLDEKRKTLCNGQI